MEESKFSIMSEKEHAKCKSFMTGTFHRTEKMYAINSSYELYKTKQDHSVALKKIIDDDFRIDTISLMDCIKNIERISQRDKDILFSYFLDGMTMEQIGILHGIVKERVSQVLEKSIMTVKRYMKRNNFSMVDFVK